MSYFNRSLWNQRVAMVTYMRYMYATLCAQVDGYRYEPSPHNVATSIVGS